MNKSSYITAIHADSIPNLRNAMALIQHYLLAGDKDLSHLAPAISAMCGVKNGSQLISDIITVYKKNSLPFFPSDADIEGVNFDCVLIK